MLTLKHSDEIAYNGSNNVARMDLYADTAADLTGVTTFDSIVLQSGSSAYDIATGDIYMLQSGGTWVKQPSNNAFDNVYTKTEIDDIVTDIDGDILAVSNDVAKQNDVLFDLLNTGGKNHLQQNSGTATRNFAIPLEIPAGDYVLSIGEITSTDTDSSVCRIAVANSADTAIFAGGTTRGADKVLQFTISEPAATLYIYASDSYSHSTGDTVTITNVMVCSQSDYDFSPEYVPYCPTLAEFYALYLSEISGINVLLGGGFP